MATKLQNEAKTAAMPREMTIEEMEAATRPSAADEAFKAGAQAPEQSNAFEIPGGQYTKRETFTLGQELEIEPASQSVVTTDNWLPPKGALEEVLAIRMEMESRFAFMDTEISKLKTQHSGPKLDGDVMLAKMRGTIYCPECDVLLEGGSATAMANMPYTHPMGSAMPKPCTLAGVRFEKPSVYVKRLPALPYRKPLPS